MPPSEFWSPEFERFYSNPAKAEPPAVPARNSSKAQWDRYHAAAEAFLAGRLARVLRQYPVDVLDTKIAGVHVGIISPKGGVAPENRDRVLINLHGGGFFANRGLSFAQLESVPVAAIGRIKVVTIDYRLAPFHRFPAASDDVEVVYRELLNEYRAEAIGIYGCSAGGVLAAQAVVRLQERGLGRPGAIGIFCSGPSAKWLPVRGDSRLWPGPTAETQWYMEGVSEDDPRAYPGSFDPVLKQFPPTLFVSGTRDFAMSAVLDAHARLLRLGVDASLYIMEGGPHAGHVMGVGTPEAHDANAYIARWFAQHLSTG